MPLSISGSGSITGTNNVTIGSGSGTAISVDTNNRVVSSSNKPMVFASIRGGGWSNYGSGSTVIYNTAHINNGNHYNSSTGIFTAPVTGYYRMMGCVLAGSSNYASHLKPRKNGTNIINQAGHINQLGGWVNVWSIVIVSCTINDTLSWWGESNGAGIYTTEDYSHMTIEFLG